MRNAIGEDYPYIRYVKLLHFTVPTTQRLGSDTEVVVHTEFGFNGFRWTSITRGTDVLKAGEKAFADAYKYYILRVAREPSMGIQPPYEPPYA